MNTFCYCTCFVSLQDIVIFAGRFYTGVGQIVDDTVSEELNNDNGKTVQVRNI